MLADNIKSINKYEPIVDFDAVSLYPSAINRLYLLEGLPQVLQPEQLNTNYLLTHLFEEEQVEPTNQVHDYLRRRYNYIKEITGIDGAKRCIAKEVKPYNKHFSFVPFGVMVLSMSKRIMNEVICTAEDLNIPVFYQDTDSIHIHQSQLDKLAKEFKRRYGRELIGKQLGQFHSDFKVFGSSDEMPIAIRSIFVMKKTYIDQLENQAGEIAFHIRCKGVIPDVIVDKANSMFPNDIQCVYEDGLVYPIPSVSDNKEYSIYHLYHALYDEEEIEFDLCKSKKKPCFEFENFNVTKSSFIRKIGLKTK